MCKISFRKDDDELLVLSLNFVKQNTVGLRGSWSHIQVDFSTIRPCPGCSFCPICEGFGCGHGVPKTGVNQHVLGQQKVCVSLFFVCMCTGANLLPGGSTRISIIRGFLGPPLLPIPAAFHLLIPSSLCRSTHHPPPHLLISSPPASITPFISGAFPFIPLYPSFNLFTAAQFLILTQYFHSSPLPHPLTLILIITFYIVGI